MHDGAARLRPTRGALDYLRARGVEICERTLREWKRRGRGPAVYRIGARDYYAEQDLDALIEQSRTEGTRP